MEAERPLTERIKGTDDAAFCAKGIFIEAMVAEAIHGLGRVERCIRVRAVVLALLWLPGHGWGYVGCVSLRLESLVVASSRPTTLWCDAVGICVCDDFPNDALRAKREDGRMGGV